MKINQEQINSKVFEVCGSFRGTISSDKYKDYILSMLFLKYISDVHDEHFNEYMEKYDGDRRRVDRMMEAEKFILPEKTSFNYLYENRSENNIGQLINHALSTLEDNNKVKLAGVFQNIDYNSDILGETKERNRILKNMLETFNTISLSPKNLEKDVIGRAYEYLLKFFASDAGQKGGEFYTPEEVAELLVKLVDPISEDRIYDPACGSGSLLIKAGGYEDQKFHDKNFKLFGQEKNASTYALCKMNMFLHEIEDSNIEKGDTLVNPKHVEDGHLMKFDIVIANPPFSLDKWGAEEASSDSYYRFHRGIPPKSKGDYAFLTHMIESTNERGKVGVILPHGVLFRGASEGKIRQKLIEENLLDAVIGLPGNLFFGTNIPASILIFKKNRERKDILFIDASGEEFYKKDKNQNTLINADKILEVYEKYETVDKLSYVATMDEIKENEYNLNIPRYVDTFEEEEIGDIDEIRSQMKATNERITQIEAEIETTLKELGL